LLANGRSIEIQDLKVGDVLLGSQGNHNRIVKLVIMPKADYKVYSFNGGRYFVTENHPFMTKAGGWVAISPSAAHKDNPRLKIGKIKIGDELVTLNGTILLKKIDYKTFKQSVVYGPALDSDGSHDYYADGYLVHNNKIENPSIL